MKNTSKGKTIGIIGYGVMGKILFESIYQLDTFSEIYVIDTNLQHKEGSQNKFAKKVFFSKNIADAVGCDVLVFAIKPQDFRELSLTLSKQTFVVSIMAGISISDISRTLGVSKIVRAMPNTPAKIQQGVVGYFATNDTSLSEKKFTQQLFSQMGVSFELESESDLDAVTAVSGSGPAYVFYMIDCFLDAALAVGLDRAQAKKIVLQTFKGALGMVDIDTDIKTLIQNVSSKGGTTEAALKEFKNSHTDKIWKKAITKAYEKSKELSSLKIKLQ